MSEKRSGQPETRARWYRSVPVELWIAAGFALLMLLLVHTTVFRELELGSYDLRFSFKPAPPQHKAVTVLEIDDDALKYVGRWPWRRNVYVDALDALRDLGAGMVVFDVEFTESSPRVLTAQEQQRFPQEVRKRLQTLSAQLDRLAVRIKSGAAGTATDIADLQQIMKRRQDEILQIISQVGQNDDLAFAVGIQHYGRVIIPVRGYQATNPESARLEYVHNTYGVKPGPGVADAEALVKTLWWDIPANPLHRSPYRLAFTNVDTDEDGVRRRISLFRYYKGRLYPQLVFAALLAPRGESAAPQKYGVPLQVALKDLVLKPGRYLRMNNVKRAGSKGSETITIPVDEQGQMLVNWAGEWKDTFRRISFADLFEYMKMRSKLFALFVELDRNIFNEQGGVAPRLASWEQLNRRQEQGKRLTADQQQAKQALAVNIYQTGVQEAQALAEAVSNYQQVQRKLTKVEQQQYSILSNSHFAVKSALDRYNRLQKKVTGAFSNALVIIGQTASSTTDLGTTPVGVNQPQVYMHANALNTILQQRFIRRAPRWLELFLIILLPVVFAYWARRLSPLRTIIAGLGGVVLFTAVNFLLFARLRYWLEFTGVAVGLLVTFLAITVIHYLQGDREKKFVKNAFQHYLSPEVINSLLKNPGELKLGGERKVLTAFFTDVQGFSTISEGLSPEVLVELLNEYLTDMSNIIFEERGTVDKFEGDAIIAFFGAPVYFEQHPLHACRAALKMQRRLEEMRPVWAEQYGHELYMRIGINTGPMVVGNMGSKSRFDYTMMGDSVNLAARLEGANKFYGSYTMISEFTREAVGDAMVVRELDLIRVVGKDRPVRVFELVDEQETLPVTMRRLLDRYAEALTAYRERRWREAHDAFAALVNDFPADGPSRTYLERCRNYLENPPGDEWDGVYSLRGK